MNYIARAIACSTVLVLLLTGGVLLRLPIWTAPIAGALVAGFVYLLERRTK